MASVKQEPTPNQIAIKALQDKREKMRASGVGEPAVEIGLSDIQTFIAEDGTVHAIICMDRLIVLVDRALRT